MIRDKKWLFMNREKLKTLDCHLYFDLKHLLEANERHRWRAVYTKIHKCVHVTLKHTHLNSAVLVSYLSSIMVTIRL